MNKKIFVDTFFFDKGLFVGCCFFFIWMILVFFAGTRHFGYDLDYENYRTYYEQLAGFSDVNRYEIGFSNLASLSKFVFKLDFSGFLIMLATISLIFKIYLILKLKNPFVFIFLYFLLVFPIHEMTQIRASIAIGLFYSGLYLLFRSRVLSLFLIFFACCFHYSIMVFIPLLIFFSHKKCYADFGLFKVLLFLAAISLLVFLFIKMVAINFVYLSYFDSDEFNAANLFSVRFLSMYFIAFLGISRWLYLDVNSKLWVLLICYGMSLFIVLHQVAPIVGFRFAEIVLFSSFFVVDNLSGRLKVLAFSVLIICSLYMGYQHYFSDIYFHGAA